MRVDEYRHEFVEFIPREISEAVLYVSIPYGTAAHLCACGCKTKVVTPITPARWKLIYDGETISLDPSIGNWQFPCRSHYWIKRNRVHWSRTFSDAEIAAGRRSDEEDLRRYFAGKSQTDSQSARIPEAKRWSVASLVGRLLKRASRK